MVLARLRLPVVAFWCLGSLLGAGSLFLDGFAGSLPDWASYGVSNLLSFVGLLCTVQALRLDRRAPWRLGWMALASLGYVLIHEFIRQRLGNAPLRLGFVALASLLLLLEVVRWAWLIARRQKSKSAMVVAGSHLLLAVGELLFLLELVQGGGGIPTRSRVYAEVVNSAAMLGNLAGDVGFIGIALERALYLWLKGADTQARLEERQVLGEQLAHLDRQRGLGLVAASLAHELKQPLTAILASAQAAQRGIAADRLAPAESLELLDKVVSNTRRISSISERIHSFIRPTVPDSGLVDLEKITREMLDLLEVDLRRLGIRVVFTKAAVPILVQGDAIQLSQVVLNVLRNAIDAVQLVPDRSIHIQVTRSAGEAVLGIRDMGPGLDPGLADQIGMPYFTTKEQGLGMGLSISAAILRQHKGSLLLRNAQGGGACVDIRLPLLAAGGALA